MKVLFYYILLTYVYARSSFFFLLKILFYYILLRHLHFRSIKAINITEEKSTTVQHSWVRRKYFLILVNYYVQSEIWRARWFNPVKKIVRNPNDKKMAEGCITFGAQHTQRISVHAKIRSLENCARTEPEQRKLWGRSAAVLRCKSIVKYSMSAHICFKYNFLYNTENGSNN